MAHRTIADDELLDRALDLFRTYGVEGVSLSQLSEAVGLEKASLYHRFPGGKDEIVRAVVARVDQWFAQHVVAPLQAESSPRRRVAVVVEQLRAFYAGGDKSCITDVLSLPGADGELAAALKSAMQAWLKAFAEIARESGLPRGLAQTRAEDAIVRIQGALVLSRVLGNTQPFQRVLKLLPQMLTPS